MQNDRPGPWSGDGVVQDIEMPKENRFRVNPKTETAPQIKSGRVCSYRYAYARSADSRAADETGQDYLTFSESGTWFAFALCDGVSQSFFGDIAARVLGDGLLKWLEGLPSAELVRPGEALVGFLGELTRRATEWVQEYPIPEEISPMLQEVLEEKRALGSEATFLCGRIDLPGAGLPEGRLLLAWMGDSRLRFWGPAGERSAELGDTFHTDQRWSTRRGPVNGRPHLFVAPLASGGRQLEVVRVLAYSDGLAALDEHHEAPTNVALRELIATAAESATSDDISLLEIWLAKVPERIKARPLPTVTGVAVGTEGNRLMVRWAALIGAIKYQVEVQGVDGRRHWTTTRTSWGSEPLLPGDYGVRVRALDGHGLAGRWSTESKVQIEAAADEPPAPTVAESGLAAAVTVPVRRKKRRRSPMMAMLLVGFVLGAAGLIVGLVTGVIPIPGREEAATPTATWTPAVTEGTTETVTSSPTTAPPPTETPTRTLVPTWTPALTATWTPSITPLITATETLSPTNTPTFTPTATELVSVIPTPTATGTELPSPLATPESGG
jgi:hypothetical protein